MASVTSTRATYTSTAVNTSATTVLPVRGNRKFLLIQNVGAEDVYVRFGETATADEDSFLFLSGGVGILMQDVIVESNYVSAITASGTSKLKIGEA